MLIIGHRGCIYEIENTLKSFSKAIEIGADGFEVDTQKTLDEKIVISHDENLKRVFGIDFNIREKEYIELVKFNLKEKIPTLEECLEFARNKNSFIDIEIKNPLDFPLVLKIVSTFNYDNLIISSFYHKEIFEAKKIYPKISFAYLYSHVPKNIKEYTFDVQFLKPNVNFLVEDYKEISNCVISWVVNEDKDIELVKNFNLFGVITDFPDRFKKEIDLNSYISYFLKLIIKEESTFKKDLIELSLLNSLTNLTIEEIKLDDENLNVNLQYPFLWRGGEKIKIKIDKFTFNQKLIFKIKEFGTFTFKLNDLIKYLS